MDCPLNKIYSTLTDVFIFNNDLAFQDAELLKLKSGIFYSSAVAAFDK